MDYEEDARENRDVLISSTVTWAGPYQVLAPLPLAPPFIFLPARGVVEASECAERYGKMEVLGQQDVVLDAAPNDSNWVFGALPLWSWAESP